MPKYKFKIKQAPGGHFFLRDEKGKDVLNSNGYMSRDAVVKAAQNFLKAGEKYKSAVIKHSKETASGFEIETA
jgi:thioredoxin-related protein